MKEYPIKIDAKTILIQQLEKVVLESGDKDLNIEGFFKRILNSISNNGVAFTSSIYNIPQPLIESISKYSKKYEG